jgi:hypothetical protein
MSDKEKVTYIGKVDFRNKELTFGIKEKDRTRHTYVIGKTGMGKSTLLLNLAIQDINNGEGICVLDPHGSMAEELLDHIPESRIKDVVYFAPFDGDFPIGLNVLEKVAADKRYLVANGVMAAFKKLFKDQFSARMEYILNNIILALLENEGQSLLGVNRMLIDKEYRKSIIANVTDPTVRDFWINEYANYTDKFAAEAAPAIQNKVGQFVANPLIRNIIGQHKTSFDIRELMDNKKILLVNLSKGKVGEGNANLIGSLLVTKIYLAAMSRADAGPYELANLPPFYLYVDEFQNFANESFASILSEARKYNLALTVAHQYVEQMEDEVKAAVFGNVGTMIVFRVGASDAEIFEKEFAPTFILDDIVNLSARQIYLRLMIDGVGSSPFSAHTLPPIARPAHSYAQSVIAYTRSTYSKPKFVVEDEVAAFYAPAKKEEKKKEAQQNQEQYVPQKSAPQGGNEKRYDTQKEPQKFEKFDRKERDLRVRKITDNTPLPPKRFEGRRDQEQAVKEVKDKTYSNTRNIEEEFHKPPAVKDSFDTSHQQKNHKKNDTTQLERISVPPPYGEKPASSLKEALDKALNEYKDALHETKEQNENDQLLHQKQEELDRQDEKKKEEARELKIRKEIDEDTLRALLDDN